MIRRLLFLVAAVFIWLWLRKLFRPRPAPKPSSGAVGVPGDRDGVMVRDRVCGTFVPENRALSLERSGERHFFCSTRCRDRFLVENAGD